MEIFKLLLNKIDTSKNYVQIDKDTTIKLSDNRVKPRLVYCKDNVVLDYLAVNLNKGILQETSDNSIYLSFTQFILSKLSAKHNQKIPDTNSTGLRSKNEKESVPAKIQGEKNISIETLKDKNFELDVVFSDLNILSDQEFQKMEKDNKSTNEESYIKQIEKLTQLKNYYQDKVKEEEIRLTNVDSSFKSDMMPVIKDDSLFYTKDTLEKQIESMERKILKLDVEYLEKTVPGVRHTKRIGRIRAYKFKRNEVINNGSSQVQKYRDSDEYNEMEKYYFQQEVMRFRNIISQSDYGHYYESRAQNTMSAKDAISLFQIQQILWNHSNIRSQPTITLSLLAFNTDIRDLFVQESKQIINSTLQKSTPDAILIMANYLKFVYKYDPFIGKKKNECWALETVFNQNPLNSKLLTTPKIIFRIFKQEHQIRSNRIKRNSKVDIKKELKNCFGLNIFRNYTKSAQKFRTNGIQCLEFAGVIDSKMETTSSLEYEMITFNNVHEFLNMLAFIKGYLK
ncbi:MAG: hypothetical protein GY730_09005 [bacterium]|nr:hypothetical protein [bacterium]